MDNGLCGQWLWSGGNETAQLKSQDGRGWDVARGVGVEPHVVSLPGVNQLVLDQL